MILAATHWLGLTSNVWSAANWASDSTGTPTTAVPTNNDDVVFAASGASNQSNVNLDVSATIKSLTVNSDTSLTSQQVENQPPPLPVNTDSTVVNNNTNSTVVNNNTDSTAVNTDSTAVNTDSTAVNTDSTAVNTDSTAANTSPTPVNTDSTAANTDPTPVNTDPTPVNPNTTPVNPNTTPVNPNTTPVNTDPTPVNTDPTPVNPNTTPVNTNTDPTPVNNNSEPEPWNGQTLTVSNTTNINALLGINSGVTLQNLGDITVSGEGNLAGSGTVYTAADQSIYVNGALTVGATNMEPGPAVFNVSTSGTGAIVMGSGSTLNIDIWAGAGLGDNTGNVASSDRLNLGGTLNATAGGTLVIGNPTQMAGFGGGDQWKLVNLGESGNIAGKLGVNDQSLHLTSTQVGNFDQATGVYTVVDTQTGLETANAQDQSLMSSMNSILGDLNGRLFSLRAGGGEEGGDGSIASSVDDGVIMGQGDGPDDAMARRVSRSRTWEVYATVGYANISLSAIKSQAGVNSQTWAPGVGIERHLSKNFALGFAATLMNTHQSYNNGLGSLDMEGIAVSAYGSYVRKSFWVDLLYSFGRFDLDSERTPPGFQTARGETTATTNAVQINGGWNFRVPAWKLVHGPFAGLDYLHVAVDGYSENGGGLAALAYADRNVDSLISRIGWTVSREFTTNFAIITPQLRVSYERQNISNNNGTSVNLINQSFSANITNEAPGQDYMVAGAGVNFQFTPDFSMLLTYQGQFFRQDMQAHYGTVRFSYKF